MQSYHREVLQSGVNLKWPNSLNHITPSPHPSLLSRSTQPSLSALLPIRGLPLPGVLTVLIILPTVPPHTLRRVLGGIVGHLSGGGRRQVHTAHVRQAYEVEQDVRQLVLQVGSVGGGPPRKTGRNLTPPLTAQRERWLEVLLCGRDR